MSKLFLHVGMPKTGTSFIQGFVNLNKEKLKELIGIDFISNRYPHEIAASLITDPALQARSDINELRNVDLSSIKKELNELKGKNVDCFCSSEYFILCDKSDILTFFLEFFEQVEIIYTVRRQDKLLASGFNQDVKSLHRTSNLVWAYKNEKTMQYFQNCKEWEELDCKIHVIDYDSVKKQKNGLNKAIFSLFTDTDKLFFEEFLEPSSSSANLSLSANEVLIKLSLNRLGLVKNDLMKEFHYLEEVKSEFTLPPAYERVIASCYYNDNKNLKNEYLRSTHSSNLTFEDINLNTNINVEESNFSWDPLNKNKTIIEFFLKNWCKS